MRKMNKYILIKKISNKLKRKNKLFLRKLNMELSRKEEKKVDYESVPAKVIVEGKKYNTWLFRPKLNKEYVIPILKQE